MRRALALLLVLSAGSARASAPELFGLSPRSAALAGGGVADGDGWDQAYTNPAGLVDATRRRLSLGYIGARYALRLEELKTAQRYNDVQARIGQQIDAGYKAEKLSRQTQIREQMNSLVSNVRYDLALADLQNAYANVYASLGIDPVEADMSSTQSVSELAGRLRTMWSKRNDAVAVSARDVARCGAPWQPTAACAG